MEREKVVADCVAGGTFRWLTMWIWIRPLSGRCIARRAVEATNEIPNRALLIQAGRTDAKQALGVDWGVR